MNAARIAAQKWTRQTIREGAQKMGKCSDCDWGSCIGCPHDTTTPDDPWDNPEEYDPAEEYDPLGYQDWEDGETDKSP